MTTLTSVLETIEQEEASLAAQAIGANTPLARYFQFRVYAELVRILEHHNDLPADFIFDIDLNDWVAGRKPPGYLKEKIWALLQRMKDNGSNTLEELCDAYCARADELKKICKLGGYAALVSGLAGFAALHAAIASLLLGLGPMAPFVLVTLAFLINEGMLDDFCGCS